MAKLILTRKKKIRPHADSLESKVRPGSHVQIRLARQFVATADLVDDFKRAGTYIRQASDDPSGWAAFWQVNYVIAAAGRASFPIFPRAL